MSPVDLQGRHLGAPIPPAAWHCVACGVEQVGPLERGCGACGAGTPGYKAPEQPTTPPTPKTIAAVRADLEQGLAQHETDLAWTAGTTSAFARWIQAHPDLVDQLSRAPAYAWAEWIRRTFAAGYQAGYQAAVEARTMPPVPADQVRAPDGSAVFSPSRSARTARTIVAALQLWIDQMLPVVAEEIAAGHYCPAEELSQLVDHYQAIADQADAADPERALIKDFA